MPIIFVMQGKCPFSDISRPVSVDSLHATVLAAKSDSDVMFCLQTYKGLRIDRSLVY